MRETPLNAASRGLMHGFSRCLIGLPHEGMETRRQSPNSLANSYRIRTSAPRGAVLQRVGFGDA